MKRWVRIVLIIIIVLLLILLIIPLLIPVPPLAGTVPPERLTEIRPPCLVITGDDAASYIC